MIECPLCKGAGIVIFQDGIPEESHGRQSQQHMEGGCPNCNGIGVEFTASELLDALVGRLQLDNIDPDSLTIGEIRRAI